MIISSSVSLRFLLPVGLSIGLLLLLAKALSCSPGVPESLQASILAAVDVAKVKKRLNAMYTGAKSKWFKGFLLSRYLRLPSKEIGEELLSLARQEQDRDLRSRIYRLALTKKVAGVASDIIRRYKRDNSSNAQLVVLLIGGGLPDSELLVLATTNNQSVRSASIVQMGRKQTCGRQFLEFLSRTVGRDKEPTIVRLQAFSSMAQIDRRFAKSRATTLTSSGNPEIRALARSLLGK